MEEDKSGSGDVEAMLAGMALRRSSPRQRAERMLDDIRTTAQVVPLNAARTAQRAIPVQG